MTNLPLYTRRIRTLAVFLLVGCGIGVLATGAGRKLAEPTLYLLFGAAWIWFATWAHERVRPPFRWFVITGTQLWISAGVWLFYPATRMIPLLFAVYTLLTVLRLGLWAGLYVCALATVTMAGLFWRDPAHFSPLDLILATLVLAGTIWIGDSFRRDLGYAWTDPLTGLANRRAFEQFLREQFEPMKRVALILVDMDGLKAINDTMGHPAGDRALVALADTLRRHLRASAFVARIGGDEFAVVLPAAGEREAQHVARRLRNAAAGLLQPCPITISLGLALRPRDGQTSEEIIAAADCALYVDKRRHRGVQAL